MMHVLVLITVVLDANLRGNSRSANQVLLASATVWMLSFLVTTLTYLSTVMSRSWLPLLNWSCHLSSLQHHRLFLELFLISSFWNFTTTIFSGVFWNFSLFKSHLCADTYLFIASQACERIAMCIIRHYTSYLIVLTRTCSIQWRTYTVSN